MRDEMLQKLDQLEKLTENMDVPLFRRRNVRWLLKNLAIRNRNHPDFQKSLEIIKELNAEGVQ